MAQCGHSAILETHSAMVRLSSAVLASSFLVLSLLPARPVRAQQAGASALADSAEIAALLPAAVGDFERTQISIPPFQAGNEGDPGITLNGVYDSPSGAYFFLGITEYRDAADRGVSLPEPEEVTVDGYPAYRTASPPRIEVLVGDRFTVDAYPAGGDASMDVLRRAVDALDLDALAALAAPAVAPDEPVASAEPEAAPFQDTGKDGDGACGPVNPDLKTRVMDQFGIDHVVPWARFLTDAQAATAEKTDGRLAFPRAGNPWLGCIQRNDILWAPLGSHSFLLRVKGIQRGEDRVTFATEAAGFGDVMGGG